MDRDGRVIVVGGGVIGAATAYYLSQSGRGVAMIEQGEFGRGCSHGNCGFVCPSHVLPLAAPGALSAALRSMLAGNSAVTVKPRLDLSLWSWLLNFALRSNHRDMLAAGHAIAALLNSSRQLYDGLLQQEPIDCEWQQQGLLAVFRSRPALAHYAEEATLLSDTFHVCSTCYDGDAVLEAEPMLKSGLAGGFLFPLDAHLRPDRLLSSWRKVLEARGVEIIERTVVSGFAESAGRARAVVTSRGDFPAASFVVATGAWAPQLRKPLGCPLPIQPGKGYSITLPRPARCPSRPLLFAEHRVAVTPMRSGFRLGSMMEFAGYDTSIDRRRLEYLQRSAEHYLREPPCEPVEEEWFGWRPMTYDGLPIIDRSPRLPNVIIAAGHNMLGLSMAPATGKLVAELIGGQTPHIDPEPYSLRRF